MADNSSVERLLGALRNGVSSERNGAVGELWDRYFKPLARLAERRLGRTRSAVDDGEGVALSAFASFCRQVENGGFRDVKNWQCLWGKLTKIAVCKVVNLIEHENAQKRGDGEVWREADLPPGADGATPRLDRAGRELDPADVVELAELWRRVFHALPDDEYRRIVRLKLEGRSVRETADILECSPSLIRLRLRVVEAVWNREVNRG